MAYEEDSLEKVKVVYNRGMGAFGFSKELFKRLNTKYSRQQINNLQRHDPYLISLVEEFGDKSGSMYCELRIHTCVGRTYAIMCESLSCLGLECVIEPSISADWITVE